MSQALFHFAAQLIGRAGIRDAHRHSRFKTSCLLMNGQHGNDPFAEGHHRIHVHRTGQKEPSAVVFALSLVLLKDTDYVHAQKSSSV